MSFFSSTFGTANTAGSTLKPSPKLVRKEVRTIPAKTKLNKPIQPNVYGSNSNSNSNGTGNGGPSQRLNGANTSLKKSASPLPAQKRPIPKPTIKQSRSESTLKSRPAKVRNGHKRKSESPSVTFGDSDEGESGDDVDLDYSRKRARTAARPAEVGTKRQIRDVANWCNDDIPSDPSTTLKHSADMTTASPTTTYTSAFPSDPDPDPTIELQYPNTSVHNRERLRLVHPKASDGYKPLDDIYKTILATLRHYLPESLSRPHLSPTTGLPATLERALRHGDLPSFRATITTFNALIASTRSSGILASHLDALPSFSLPLALTEVILEQVYERTVSPRVDSLRRYTTGTDNVYGEIRPAFASQIFRDTQLSPSSVFVDLGSGVGNVVLQAALELGCDAWGIEVMDNPAALAAAQLADFPGRCRMWGVRPGRVRLVHGDFLADGEIAEVLRRADVVLVNNKAFTAETDARLTQLFLDFKDGARIVSLKSFVPSGWKLTERTSGSVVGMLEVVRREFWDDYVSWTHEGGEYFVSTKDPSRLRKFLGRGK